MKSTMKIIPYDLLLLNWEKGNKVTDSFVNTQINGQFA